MNKLLIYTKVFKRRLFRFQKVNTSGIHCDVGKKFSAAV